MTVQCLVPITLLLIADDLLMPSRIREGIKPLGYTLELATSLESAVARAPQCQAILINLTARRYDPLAIIRALKAQFSIPILAFVGHVEREKQEAARTAGVDFVVANSSVSLHLETVLTRLLRGEEDSGEAI